MFGVRHTAYVRRTPVGVYARRSRGTRVIECHTRSLPDRTIHELPAGALHALIYVPFAVQLSAPCSCNICTWRLKYIDQRKEKLWRQPMVLTHIHVCLSIINFIVLLPSHFSYKNKSFEHFETVNPNDSVTSYLRTLDNILKILLKRLNTHLYANFCFLYPKSTRKW